jgi:hypothetical protein
MLTFEELNRLGEQEADVYLNELAQKRVERNPLFFNPGDTVYVISKSQIFQRTVDAISIRKNQSGRISIDIRFKKKLFDWYTNKYYHYFLGLCFITKDKTEANLVSRFRKKFHR